MQGVKPWQIILMVAAVLAVIGSVLYSCSTSSDLGLSKEIPMVDVVTGDRFMVKIPKSGSLGIPCKHPDSGEMTLVPYSQGPDGGWYVSERFSASLGKNKDIASKGVVDFKTFAVKVTDKPVRNFVGE